jgi:hypothetical protein
MVFKRKHTPSGRLHCVKRSSTNRAQQLNDLTSNITSVMLHIMRTTIDLDIDLINIGKQLAEQRNQTLGQVFSSLIRKALTPPQQPTIRNGVPLFNVKPTSTKIDLAFVNSLRDDDS